MEIQVRDIHIKDKRETTPRKFTFAVKIIHKETQKLLVNLSVEANDEQGCDQLADLWLKDWPLCMKERGRCDFLTPRSINLEWQRGGLDALDARSTMPDL